MLSSLQRLVYFDQALAVDAYIAADLKRIRRHQGAIRELSIPVIQMHKGILLLPLMGALDRRRAEQLTETVLSRVEEEQARCLIIDVAGVAVVDRKVTQHLIGTTKAARLLGAQTVLPGINARVPKTMVQLGADLAAMHTVSRLSQGIELALSMVGKSIQTRPPAP